MLNGQASHANTGNAQAGLILTGHKKQLQGRPYAK